MSRARACGGRKGRLVDSGVPNIQNPLLEQGTGLQRVELFRGLSGRWWGALFCFWILPNQKNLGNDGNCYAETQTLPGRHRPVYK